MTVGCKQILVVENPIVLIPFGPVKASVSLLNSLTFLGLRTCAFRGSRFGNEAKSLLNRKLSKIYSRRIGISSIKLQSAYI